MRILVQRMIMDNNGRFLLIILCYIIAFIHLMNSFMNLSNNNNDDDFSSSSNSLMVMKPKMNNQFTNRILEESEETINNNNLSSRTMICYGSQGNAKEYWKFKYRFETIFSSSKQKSENEEYQFFYHAYDRPCAVVASIAAATETTESTESTTTTSQCFHQNGTVPAEGRNIVVKKTIQSSNWKKCKYFVFFDDDTYLIPHKYKNQFDIKSKNGNNNNENNKSKPKIKQLNTKIDGPETIEGWKTFHEMLLDPNTTHPLITPQTSKFDDNIGDIITYQSCVDEIFWAIRYDHIDFVYPLATIGRLNYWLTNTVMFYVMEKCYSAGIKVDYRWYTLNNNHRYESQVKDKSSNNRYTDLIYRNSFTKKILDRDFPQLRPWIINTETYLKHSCTIKYQPSVGVHPKCKSITERRLYDWLNDKHIP